MTVEEASGLFIAGMLFGIALTLVLSIPHLQKLMEKQKKEK